MWRTIKENKSNKGIGRIVSIACAFERGTNPKNPKLVWYRATRIHARVATMIKGKVTRRSDFSFETEFSLWAWINRISQTGNPITIFCERSALTVPAAGVFHEIDNGGIRLEWQAEQRKTAKPRDNKPKTVAGIVCLTAPPTIVIGRLCSGAIVRILDVANWGVTSIDLRDRLYADRTAAGRECPTAIDPRPLTIEETTEAIEGTVVWLLRTTFEKRLGMFRWTAASQAMAAWRHGRMLDKVTTHDEQPVQEMERAAYYGGRISVWYAKEIGPQKDMLPTPIVVPTWGPQHVPEGPIYGLDVNGLFPVVMRDCLFPKRLVDWRIVPEDSWTGRLDDPAASIAEVVIHTAGEQYPLRSGTDTLYPRGTYRTWLAGPELARAVQRGRVLKVGSWARYELADLFGAFVRELWGYRQAATGFGTAFERRYWKRLMNSLYGKWGQRRVGWTAAPQIQSPGPWQHWTVVDQHGKLVHAYRTIGRHVQVSQDGGPARDSFAAIAAFITSNARLVMDRARECVGEGHYYYQAIDSLYTDTDGYNKLVMCNLVHPTELGMLKQEGKYEEGRFLRPGRYVLDGEETCSGRMLTATQDSLGQWTEEHVPSLDLQVVGVPASEVKCTLETAMDMRTPLHGMIDANGWVKPPVVGLTGH